MPDSLKRIFVAACFVLGGSLLFAEEGEGPLSFEEVIRLGLDRSPELRRSEIAIRNAELAEPLLLSETDTRLESGYSVVDDRSPRVAPAFEGERSKLEQFDVSLVQNTIIGTEARLSWENERLTNPTPFRLLDPSAESSLTLTVRQNLVRYFLGRPDIARRRMFRSDVEAAKERFRSEMSETAAAVARDYFHVIYAVERTTIAAKNVQSAERLLNSHQEKRRYGLVEDSEVLQARVSLDTELLERDAASSDLAVALNALRSRLKLEAPPELAEGRPELPPVPTSLEAALEQGLTNRPDLRAARAELDAARWRVRTQKLDTLPELAVFGSYGAAGLARGYSDAWDDLGTRNHLVRSAGVDLTVSLGFRKERLERKASRLEEEAAATELDRLERNAGQEIRDAWVNFQLRSRALADREKLVVLQRRKLEAEEANFRRGRSSTDLVVRFRQDVYRAELDVAQARAGDADARLELARATGALLEEISARSGR